MGDVYSLDFGDGEFDIVHGHQVLQQFSEPVLVLVELRRVLRGGGVLAARDGALGGWVWAPSRCSTVGTRSVVGWLRTATVDGIFLAGSQRLGLPTSGLRPRRGRSRTGRRGSGLVGSGPSV
jgi:SAM-dependent methyltransferase